MRENRNIKQQKSPICVDEFLPRKPNKITVKALKQSQGGKGLKKCNNLDGFSKISEFRHNVVNFCAFG